MLIRLDKSPYKFGGELSFSTSYLNVELHLYTGSL